jgi:hypothetical protein
MDRINFFETSELVDFETYLSQTHDDFDKKDLKSLRTILQHYIIDLNSYFKIADDQMKSKLGKLKTSFTVSRSVIC